MAREPFMPLFFGDFLAATALWNGEQQALYLLLLAYQWSNGPLPADPTELAKVVRYEPKRFKALWPKVGQKFQPTDAGLVNPRLEEHRERSEEISRQRAVVGSAGGVASGEARRRKARATREANASSLLQQTGSKQEANPEANAKQNRTIHTILSEDPSENLSQETHAVPLDAPAGARAPEDAGGARPEPTPAGRACVALKAAGIADVNPCHPTLLALLAEGAGVDELVAAGQEAAAKGKGFRYALAVAQGRRKDASTSASGLRGPLKAEARPVVREDAFDVARRQNGG